jgi:iron complex outermembrane receptor protein
LINTPNQSGHYGQTEGYAMRGKLLFKPTDTLKIVLAGDYSYTTGNGGAIQLGVGGNQAIPASFGKFTNAQWTNNDFAPSPYSQRLRGFYARGDLDLLGGTLTAISGYRMNDSHAINDDVPVGTATPVFDRRQDVRNRSFTQEVRFASAPNRLSYVVGAYFLTADVSTTNTFNYSPLSTSSTGAAIRPNPGITNIVRVQSGNVRSIAVFGEATFKLTDKLAVVAGGRYTSDRKQIDYHAYSNTDPGAIAAFGFPGEVFASGGKTWNAFTPRFTVKYEPVRKVNLYATFARGFKSGGFVDNAYRNPTIPLEPEKARNIEVGAKTRLLDNRLDFNVSLFDQKTDNLQNFSGAGASPIPTTARCRCAAPRWKACCASRPPSASTPITPTGGPLHLAARSAGQCRLFGQSRQIRAARCLQPGRQLCLCAQGGATLTPQADFSYSSKISTDDANTLRLYSNLYDKTEGKTLNARLTYRSANGRWQIGAWVKNLTNNFQIVNADDITSFLAVPGRGSTYWKIFTNQPRTYGLTVSLRP